MYTHKGVKYSGDICVKRRCRLKQRKLLYCVIATETGS